jgi:DNA-binding MarR family transcriptional regulator
MQTFDGIPARWKLEFDGVEEFEAAVSILAAELYIRDRITEVLNTYRLTVSQWTIMTILHFSDDGNLAVGALASQLGVHSSTITKALDKLDPTGWIRRAPLDRRTTLVYLTEAGSAHLRKVQEALAAARFGFADMSKKQLRAIAFALKPVTPTLGEE